MGINCGLLKSKQRSGEQNTLTVCQSLVVLTDSSSWQDKCPVDLTEKADPKWCFLNNILHTLIRSFCRCIFISMCHHLGTQAWTLAYVCTVSVSHCHCGFTLRAVWTSVDLCKTSRTKVLRPFLCVIHSETNSEPYAFFPSECMGNTGKYSPG